MVATAPLDYDVSILARLLGNDRNGLPNEIAHYLLTRKFNRQDKVRMHELAVRNQSDDLSEDEKKELFAYAKAGTILSILQAKARLALKGKPRGRHSA